CPDATQTLPPPTAKNANSCCFGTWQMAILPYVEQDPMWRAYQNFGGTAATGPNYQQQANLLVTSQRLTLFTCPSDTPNAAKSASFNGTTYNITQHNYLVNVGNIDYAQGRDGVLPDH